MKIRFENIICSSSRLRRTFVIHCVAILTSFCIGSASQANLICQDIFQTDAQRLEILTLKFKAEFDQVFALLKELDPKILVGKKTPGWTEFNQLEILLGLVSKINDQYDGMLKGDLSQLTKLIRARSDVRTLIRKLSRHSKSIDTENRTYTPTEYELKVAYQNLLNRVNEELPNRLKFRIQRLHLDARRKTFKTSTDAIISNLEQRFASVFTTTGFKSYAKFEAYLRKSKDPNVKRALEVIDKDQVEVTMRRPEQGRFWIAKTGFHNQFVTGSSRGTLDNSLRNNAENYMLGVRNLEQYTAMDGEIKPKYATLSTKPEAKLNSDISSSSQYGSDLYRFKTENIKNRLTFYPTDSLGPGWRQTMDDGKAWDEHMIPWSNRLLMVPFMLKEIENSNFKGQDWPAELIVKTNDVAYFSARYWEAQILGPLKLSDVREFEFSTEPPSGDFLQKLKFHNIRILDGRVSPAVEWNGQ